VISCESGIDTNCLRTMWHSRSGFRLDRESFHGLEYKFDSSECRL